MNINYSLIAGIALIIAILAMSLALLFKVTFEAYAGFLEEEIKRLDKRMDNFAEAQLLENKEKRNKS